MISWGAARSVLRRGVHEAICHQQRWRAPRRRPCVVMFPSSQNWDPASNLRAWLVAPALKQIGWRVIVVPEPLSLSQRLRILRLERPDVIWMQQTRHLLNQPYLYAPVPCVFDADDADYLDPRHHERIARCATDAAAVVGGSRFVAGLLGRHNQRSHVLWTCTPAPTAAPVTPPQLRAPIVAWAHERPMLYKREADFVQRIMVEVCKRTSCTFWLFGSNPTDARAWLDPIRRAGGDCVAVPLMSYEKYLNKVAECAIGLQPVCLGNEFSRGKSFGKVLAYLAGQVAVVASDAVDHPLFFRHGENGFVARESLEDWVVPIVMLCENATLRAEIAQAGWLDFHNRLTTDVFARLLDPILRKAARLPLLGPA
jgi:Glycosyl transferases group 1